MKYIIIALVLIIVVCLIFIMTILLNHNNNNDISLLEDLKKININTKIIVPKEYQSDLILLTDGGIFLIKIYQDENSYKKLLKDAKKIEKKYKVITYKYLIDTDKIYDEITSLNRNDLLQEIKDDYNLSARFITEEQLININNNLR